MKPAMAPERWQLIEELFHRSLEREASKRPGFLADACDGDGELRQQVEALLVSYEATDDFLDVPPLAGAISSIVAEKTARKTGSSLSLIGHRIAHYEIQSLLGSGGMGEVYLAHDLKLDRQIAIKILPAQFTEDNAHVHRFEREARAASALNHPNIITIHEIGRDENTHFIATEFVTGQTLREKIAAGRISLNETLGIAIQITDALSAAHAAGIVHRDIKPENVMVRPDGLVKVLDFGLAKAAATENTSIVPLSPAAVTMETDAGMLMGTLAYLSPEQVLRREVDHRTDLFSLGVLLFEMVTGTRPFVGDSAQAICNAILSQTLESVTKLRPETPTALECIIERALERERGARYQTAGQLRRELEKLEDELDTPQNRWSGWAWKMALGAAVVLAAVLLWQIQWLPQSKKQGSLWIDARATIKRLTAHGRVVRAALSPDGRQFAYVQIDQRTRSLWLGQTSDGSSVPLQHPHEVIPGTLIFSPDGKGIYYIGTTLGQDFSTLYRLSTSGSVTHKVLDHIDSQLSFSHDGQRIAFVRLIDSKKRENALVIARASDGKEERVLAVREWARRFSFSGPSWSPDGKMLAVGALTGGSGTTDKEIVGVRLADGAISLLSDERWDGTYRLAWLPDGSGLVMIATDKAGQEWSQLWHLPYPSGAAHRITSDLDQYDQSNLSLSADGRTVLAVQLRRANSIWLAPTAKLQEARQLTHGSPGSATGVYGLEWTPNDRILYTAFAGEGTSIWGMASDGSDAKQLTSPNYIEKSFSLSANGEHVVFQSSRNGELEVWRSDLDGAHAQRLTSGGRNSQPQVSPDGRWVIYTSNRGLLNVWRVSIEGGEPTQLTSAETMWPRISPDGKLFACAYRAALDKPWQLAVYAGEGGLPLKLFDRPRTANFNIGFRWAPDGRGITYRDWEDGVWLQPLTGGPPQRLSGLPNEKIYSYAWSPDGNQFAFTRGTESYDVVLISNSR